jgi:hypothetical protein
LGAKAENICSQRVFRLLTQLRHRLIVSLTSEQALEQAKVLARAERDKDGVAIYPWRAGLLSMAWRSVRQIASRMPAASQRHYRHRHVFVYCGQSLQSMIPTMIIEPAATTTEQITGNSPRTAITAARPLWFRA